ncbi:hypothetical protein KR074_011911 [Drosophila pseudoananassae]|nr:hypothetical protein KR074_011911 [Drosophila pseudoananassae]
MDNLDPSTTLLPTDSNDLKDTREHHLKNVLKMKLVLEELRRLDLGSQQSPEIKRALKLISIGDYVRLGETHGQEHLLDLQVFNNFPPLNYTDRKAVRTRLSAQLRNNLQPIVELGEKIRQEFPDAFTRDADLSADQEEIMKLEEEHRNSLEQLVDLQERKCLLLKGVADLKLGPQLSKELKLQQAQAQLVQTKAELLRGFFVHQAATITDHSVKAHKEVETQLDELLASKNISIKN